MTSVSLKCDVCDREFSSKSTLSTHQKTAKFCLAKKASLSKGVDTQTQVSSSEPTQTSPSDEFINEIKRNYEDKIRDRDERISTLESLIEKMEQKIDKYETTITAIVLNSLGYRIRRQRCSDPACDGCRAEDAAEARLTREKQEQENNEDQDEDQDDDNEENDKNEENDNKNE